MTQHPPSLVTGRKKQFCCNFFYLIQGKFYSKDFFLFFPARTRSTGRSTGQRSHLTAGSYRSTGRSTGPRYREQTSLFRSTARSTAQIQRAKLSGPVDRSVDRPTVLPDVHSSVHVGRPLGRPALGSVDLAVDRPGLSASSGSEKQVIFNPKNLHKISKITQK